MAQDKKVTVSAEIPQSLRDSMVEKAKENGRSFSSELRIACQNHIEGSITK